VGNWHAAGVMLRSFDHRDFAAETLLEAKRGRRISVCLPARDEAATIGAIVRVIRDQLMARQPLVDELIVIDDGSTDATVPEARASGAEVLVAAEILPEYGTAAGKGQTLWKAVHAASGDLVVFCDADVSNFHAGFVLGLLGPLLTRDDVSFVKGFYRRPLDGRAGEGGRVTELVARPLVSLLFPHLAPLIQPLAGECAARREVLENVPFVDGYGVDLGLLIDVAQRFGVGGIVQCDLGERVHRNRPLAELSVQSLAILRLALARSGAVDVPATNLLVRPGAESVAVAFSERPPLAKVPAHRKTA
jgi:glucosyl-3-phosphoglycerate synthase